MSTTQANVQGDTEMGDGPVLSDKEMEHPSTAPSLGCSFEHAADWDFLGFPSGVK